MIEKDTTSQSRLGAPGDILHQLETRLADTQSRVVGLNGTYLAQVSELMDKCKRFDLEYRKFIREDDKKNKNLKHGLKLAKRDFRHLKTSYRAQSTVLSIKWAYLFVLNFCLKTWRILFGFSVLGLIIWSGITYGPVIWSNLQNIQLGWPSEGVDALSPENLIGPKLEGLP
ncbi:MAG: hypothetical protein ABJO86_13150 [Lentilitoribacter sp.]